MRWRKRVFTCPELVCPVRTWTEQAGLAEPRQVLTARTARWATDQVAAIEATPASIAPRSGVSWSTVWTAIVRGKGDPLYDIRKLLLLGAERVDEAGWARIWAGLRDGDPDDAVTDTWVAKEKVRAVYLTDEAALAAERLADAIAWCTAPEATSEQGTLAKTLRRWRAEIVAHHATGASNGPVEAANLTIKQIKRSGRGFRSFANYRLRILLTGQRALRETQPVTSIRPRRPRLVA